MTSHFPFDLNNRELFPILHKTTPWLFEYMPIEFGWTEYEEENTEDEKKDYETIQQYRALIERNSDKETRNEYIRIIGSVERLMAQFNEDMLVVDLLSERDNYLATNVPGNEQREFVIKSYNRIVIEKVEDFIYNLEERIRRDFPAYFDETEREKLNIKSYLSEFYEEFDSSDDLYTSELQQQADLTTLVPDNLIRFDNAGQKYLLLKKLGFFDFLKTEYNLPSAAKLSLLLAYVTDTKNSKSFENILSQIDYVNGEYYPYTERNEIKVTNILDQIGIQGKPTTARIRAIKKK